MSCSLLGPTAACQTPARARGPIRPGRYARLVPAPSFSSGGNQQDACYATHDCRCSPRTLALRSTAPSHSVFRGMYIYVCITLRLSSSRRRIDDTGRTRCGNNPERELGTPAWRCVCLVDANDGRHQGRRRQLPPPSYSREEHPPEALHGPAVLQAQDLQLSSRSPSASPPRCPGSADWVTDTSAGAPALRPPPRRCPHTTE